MKTFSMDYPTVLIKANEYDLLDDTILRANRCFGPMLRTGYLD